MIERVRNGPFRKECQECENEIGAYETAFVGFFKYKYFCSERCLREWEKKGKA